MQQRPPDVAAPSAEVRLLDSSLPLPKVSTALSQRSSLALHVTRLQSAQHSNTPVHHASIQLSEGAAGQSSPAGLMGSTAAKKSVRTCSRSASCRRCRLDSISSVSLLPMPMPTQRCIYIVKSELTSTNTLAGVLAVFHCQGVRYHSASVPCWHCRHCSIDWHVRLSSALHLHSSF